MIHSLMMFLAPDASSQATLNSPPAVAKPVIPLERRGGTLRFCAGVLGNMVGFGALLAGCWFSLQLMQVFLVVG